MRPKSLSSILSRSNGHEALLELLELDDDVKALKAWTGKIWDRVGAGDLDDKSRDDLLRLVGNALAISRKLRQPMTCSGEWLNFVS